MKNWPHCFNHLIFYFWKSAFSTFESIIFSTFTILQAPGFFPLALFLYPKTQSKFTFFWKCRCHFSRDRNELLHILQPKYYFLPPPFTCLNLYYHYARTWKCEDEQGMLAFIDRFQIDVYNISVRFANFLNNA